MHGAGPGAPNPYMPPPMPNTGQQPHIPQNFAPTGRKKALICACNYRCWPMKISGKLAHAPLSGKSYPFSYRNHMVLLTASERRLHGSY